MNCMHDLSTGQHKIILVCKLLWLEIVEISFPIKQFLNKLDLKNTIRYIIKYIQCAGQSKIGQTCSFLNGF